MSKTEQNITNSPEHIAAACKRALAWVEDIKLRTRIYNHIQEMEKR